MIRVIMGKKGSGKTKQMIEMINNAVQTEHGNVVCIEKGNKLTFDIHYQIRLVEASQYNVDSYTALKGFISGLHAGNFDITHVFIDNLYSLSKSKDPVETENFLDWCNLFSAENKVAFTFTIADDPSNPPEYIARYMD